MGQALKTCPEFICERSRGSVERLGRAMKKVAVEGEKGERVSVRVSVGVRVDVCVGKGDVAEGIARELCERCRRSVRET